MLPPLIGAILRSMGPTAARIAVLAAAVVLCACGGSPASDSRSPSGSGVEKRVAASVDAVLASDTKLEAVRAVLVVAEGKPLVERYVETTPESSTRSSR